MRRKISTEAFTPDFAAVDWFIGTGSLATARVSATQLNIELTLAGNLEGRLPAG